ncbi:hypothetical protein [Tsukamurella ocularis]|uniref:hypothetical protein n=1 Tax=Tsukamurella ocularis TaxID=1970234 RepID=UPI0021679A3A|nr:hypothetical protein [Tsukamurella ocularis]MCS3779380.1 hypothetical protein [Tsukamurella ocularis]MCS3789890.1 hypothetical protein [Tsukamurella ocularis]
MTPGSTPPLDAFTRRRIANELDAELLDPDRPVRPGTGEQVFAMLDEFEFDYRGATSVTQLHALVEDRLQAALDFLGGWPGASYLRRCLAENGWAPLEMKLRVIGFGRLVASGPPASEVPDDGDSERELVMRNHGRRHKERDGEPLPTKDQVRQRAAAEAHERALRRARERTNEREHER